MRVSVSTTLFNVKAVLTGVHRTHVRSLVEIGDYGRIRWMSLHILRNAQSVVLGERGDRWLNRENAVCMMHSQCISCHDQSVRSSAFRPLTWQKRAWHDRYDLLPLVRCRLHAASLCPAFAISRWRFRGRISPILVTAAGEKRRRRNE